MNSESFNPVSLTEELPASLPRVFVTRKLPQQAMDRIAKTCDAFIWPDSLPPNRNDLLAHAIGCDGLITLLSDCIDAEIMEAAGPQLKVISNFAVGFNNVDIAEATRRGILVGNTPDVLTDATADIAVTLLLAAARHVRPAAQHVIAGEWKTWEPTGWLGADLVGRTVGIVGMGRIGQATALRLAGGWGMKILYTSRSAKELPTQLSAERVELDRLLRESDFVSLHTDLNDKTRHLIGLRELSLMKPTGILINTSRGGVVDQDALVQALQNKQIFAAGLDVTDPEPLPANHPLPKLNNCIVLPHIASATRDTRDAMAEIAVDNLLAGVGGKALRSAVNAL